MGNSCRSFAELLEEVQERDEPKSSPWRNHLVQIAKERICGHPSQRKICCPKEIHPDNPFKFIGEFVDKEDVGGQVYLLDEKTLVIKEFRELEDRPVVMLMRVKISFSSFLTKEFQLSL